MPSKHDMLPPQMQSVALDADQVEAMRMRMRRTAVNDLWFFNYHVCGYKDIDNPLHKAMCRVWQKRIEFPNTMWQVPRSHLKTCLWTVGGNLWEAVRAKLKFDTDLRFLISSGKDDKSEAFLSDIRNIIESGEVFRWLFPEFCYDKAPDELRKRAKVKGSRLDFPNSRYAGAKEGTFNTGSMESDRTGFHYDRLHYDDFIDEKNSESALMLERGWRWWRNQQPLKVGPDSIMRVVGTRWDYDDSYGRIEDIELADRQAQEEQGKPVNPSWLFFKKAVWEQDEDGNYVKDKDGDRIPIWPERYNNEEIEKIRRAMASPYLFSCQYENNPIPDESATFKRTDIKEIDELYIPENVNNFIAVDLAEEEAIKGDYTVITVASFDEHARMYVREIVRYRNMTVYEATQHIWRLTQRYKPIRVGVETVAFQKSLLRSYKHEAARNGWNIPWTEIKRGNSSKHHRIRGLQPRTQRGDFYVVKNLTNLDAMTDEMVRFPKGSHDDILDTLADLEAIYWEAAPSIPEPPKPTGTFEDICSWLDEDVETGSNPDISWSTV